MPPIAYGLRADYEGTVDVDGVATPAFLGGRISLGDDRELDTATVHAGPIIVEDTDYVAVNALDAYAPFKRVTVDPAAEATVSAYADRNAPALRDELRLRDLSTAGTKPELVERLEAHDAAVAAGDTVTAQDPTPEAPASADHNPEA